MKKTLVAILAASATFAAFGQGKIQLDNLLSTGLVPITLDGNKIIGDKYKIEVWSGANLIGAGALYPNVDGARAGRFNLGSFEVPGVGPGAKAPLQVRAWDSTSGATYAAATIKGSSAVFDSAGLGGPNPAGGPDILTPKLDGLGTFSLVGGPTTVVPEPSTIALAALGAAALVCRRSRK